MTVAATALTFNLVDRPWIPCVLPDGRLVELSLLETLSKAAEIRELHDGSPLVTAGLHRLLLAVIHSALRGPRRLMDWRAVWGEGTFDRPWLRDYLTKWHDRFDLFDPTHPFLQALGLQNKPVHPCKLAHELASGNTPTLFDHTTRATAPPVASPVAARWLVSFLSYALGGTTGRSEGESPSADAAPLVGGVSILIRGANLFETLALNLLLYDPINAKPIPGTREDCPAWEADSSRERVTRAPRGYLDWLTWQAHRALLHSVPAEPWPTVDQAQIAGGAQLPPDLTVREPSFAYQRSSAGLVPVRFGTERALWRDSTALFQIESNDEQPPRACELLAQRVADGEVPRDSLFALDVFGLASFHAKIFFWRRERLALPVALLGNAPALDDLRTGLNEAQEACDGLWSALARAAEIALAPESDGKGRKPQKADVSTLVKSFQAEATYWGHLAIAFEAFLPALVHDRATALARWREATRDAARAAFERARRTLGSNARGLKAQALGEDRLQRGLRDALPAIFPARMPTGAPASTLGGSP